MLVTLAACAALSFVPPQIPGTPTAPLDAVRALQREDGSWTSVEGAHAERLETTSVMLLQLLGEGQTAHVGPQHKRVAAALDWVRGTQQKDGSFSIDGVPATPTVQALASLALCEAHFLSGESDVHATRAAGFLVRTLHPEGGWRTSTAEDAVLDTRTSAWGALALASAADGQLIELGDELKRIANALTRHNARPVLCTKRALAHELVARFVSGDVPEEGDFLRRVELTLAAPNPWSTSGKGVEPELRYLQSFIAYQTGGETWKQWQAMLRTQRELVADEEAAGAFVHDPRLTPGGRLAAFGWNLLTLGVEYRYARVVGER